MNEPLLNMLGMARRAGKLSIGFDAAKQAVLSGKASAVYLASDISAKTAKEARWVCDPAGVPVCPLPWDMLTVSNAVGIKCGCVSLNDKGFFRKTDALYQKLNREENNI